MIEFKSFEQENKEVFELLSPLAEDLKIYNSLELTKKYGTYPFLVACNRGYLVEPNPSKEALKEYHISKSGLMFLKGYREEHLRK